MNGEGEKRNGKKGSKEEDKMERVIKRNGVDRSIQKKTKKLEVLKKQKKRNSIIIRNGKFREKMH